MNGDNGFRYTYSAPDHQEVLRIRSKYLPAKESKLEELKRLDRTVQNSGTMESLIVGVTGCMVFGLGLCLAMKVIGDLAWMGILLGLAGITGMLFAYPVHQKVLRRTKEKVVPRILELAQELSGEV